MPTVVERANFFVVTGASGGGKSTLIRALRRRGALCVDEAGREIVREELAREGDGLPWADRMKFRDLLLSRSLAKFDAVEERSAPVFFDRGIPEAIAWSQLIGAPLDPARAEQALSRRYAPTVFVAPLWREIFTVDDERRHDWRSAVANHEATLKVYRALGYCLIDLPKCSVKVRADFVEEQLSAFDCYSG